MYGSEVFYSDVLIVTCDYFLDVHFFVYRIILKTTGDLSGLKYQSILYNIVEYTVKKKEFSVQ